MVVLGAAIDRAAARCRPLAVDARRVLHRSSLVRTLADILAAKRILVCVGSGGVGKTTSAAALALEAALRGRRTLVLTIDPAKRLANSLGLEALGHEIQEVPAERLRAVVEASFGPEQFDRECVASWLAFYVLAQTSHEAARLLKVYARRLDSNLVYDLRRLVGDPAAKRIAQGIASMIDGLYIRCALQDRAPDAEEAKRLTLDYLDLCLAQASARTLKPAQRLPAE